MTGGTTDFFDDARLLAPRETCFAPLGDGAFELTSPRALLPYARCTGEWLEQWAMATPDATAFAEPSSHGWRGYTWRELRSIVGRVAQSLLDLALPADKPIVVLSDNSLDHLVLLLAGQHIGHAVSSVSSAYSRLAQGDFTRIGQILGKLDPALVYAADTATYEGAVHAGARNAVAVYSSGAPDTGALAFAALAETTETSAVMARFHGITPDTHAKYLLTSGSTGSPKVVVNTHRMLCANQQMIAQTLGFLEREKPVFLDWLPWSHTFGGNHNVNLVLRSGGTMYIDDGRPTPGLIDRTVAHLREVRSNLHFNVPRGYEMLLPALEADPVLARHFLGPLKMLFYAGSSMPESIWTSLERIARTVRDEPLWLTTAWGSTETSPAVTYAHWRLDRPGVIGLPMPGVRLKFVPNGDKLEMRVKGDIVFPAYRDDPAATAEAFDADGYYRIGDAGYLYRDDPRQGVVFDGRVAEDFKLTTGTWVSVGPLRVNVVSQLAPHVQDVVVTGHGRCEIGLLVFLTEAGRRLPLASMVEFVREGLQKLHGHGAGSSQTPRRALLLDDTPSAAHGEITDKGYLNQRAALHRRAADVELLYSDARHERMILVDAAG